MSHTYAEPERDRQQENVSSARQAEERRGPSHPPIALATPSGAPQGGLLDWFRSRFSGREPEEEGQQWVEEEYGEIDPQYVTDKPEPGSRLAAWAVPYPQEGPAQAPVFETHSFMPRESQDNVEMIHLHSFVGLRFTQMDPVSNRFTRKRVKVGFGGGGHMFAPQGTLMNDNGTQADMSTETPVTKAQLEAVMDAIPAMASQPYNVLTHNCNDFTRALAEMAGASVPAELHDTMLGPVSAYKRLSNAAEGGQQGRTRFFQGGGAGGGQMAGGHNRQLIEQFRETAKTAARRDGVPFLLNPSLRDAADQVAQAALPMRRFLETASLESEADEQALEEATETASQAAENLIHLHLWKGHPRVNSAAMKVVAIASQLHNTFLPEARPITSFSPQEIETVLTQRTGAEEDAQVRYTQGVQLFTRIHQEDRIAGLDRGVRNEALFGSGQSSLSGSGDIFLQSMGLSAPSLLRQHRPPDANDSEAKSRSCNALIRQIADALTNEDGMGVNEYLSVFFRGRDNLTDAQLGAMAVRAILSELQRAAEAVQSPLKGLLSTLGATASGIAASREDDSLENNTERATRMANTFAGRPEPAPGAPQYTFTPAQLRHQEIRQEILELTNVMEAVMAAKFEAVRARAQEEQAPRAPQE